MEMEMETVSEFRYNLCVWETRIMEDEKNVLWYVQPFDTILASVACDGRTDGFGIEESRSA